MHNIILMKVTDGFANLREDMMSYVNVQEPFLRGDDQVEQVATLPGAPRYSGQPRRPARRHIVWGRLRTSTISRIRYNVSGVST